MNTQKAINLLTKYLEIKKSQSEWSLDGEKLDEALAIVLSHINSLSLSQSLSPDKLSTEMHLLTPPLRCFLIPGSKPELKGLEVAFDSEGYMGVRCAANKLKGFHLTKEAAIILSQLITREMGGLSLSEGYFALAAREVREEDM